MKLFRKARQRLLIESKFSKYLLYAIGEIVLVVLGILIALSISNWNQGRLMSNKETTYLENIEHDLQSQLNSIDVQLVYEQKYFDHGMPIVQEHIQSNRIVVDTALCRRLNVLIERKTFVRTDPTFEDLISSGNIGVLKDISLRNALIEYYQELERIEKVIQNNNTLYTDQVFGKEIINMVYIGTYYTDRLLTISTELLKDPQQEMKFMNLIEHRNDLASYHMIFLRDLREKTTDMIELIQTNTK